MLAGRLTGRLKGGHTMFCKYHKDSPERCNRHYVVYANGTNAVCDAVKTAAGGNNCVARIPAFYCSPPPPPPPPAAALLPAPPRAARLCSEVYGAEAVSARHLTPPVWCRDFNFKRVQCVKHYIYYEKKGVGSRCGYNATTHHCDNEEPVECVRPESPAAFL